MRSDIHRPSAIQPDDYVEIAWLPHTTPRASKTRLSSEGLVNWRNMDLPCCALFLFPYCPGMPIGDVEAFIREMKLIGHEVDLAELRKRIHKKMRAANLPLKAHEILDSWNDAKLGAVVHTILLRRGF